LKLKDVNAGFQVRGQPPDTRSMQLAVARFSIGQLRVRVND